MSLHHRISKAEEALPHSLRQVYIQEGNPDQIEKFCLCADGRCIDRHPLEDFDIFKDRATRWARSLEGKPFILGLVGAKRGESIV